MGLAIAQGDPKLNMVNAIPAHNFKRGTSTGSNWLSRLANSTTETKVRLIGSPRGRPTEFVYYRREDTKDRLLVVTTDSWFEFRMSVEVPVAFPEFEIVRRHPHMGIMGPSPGPSCRCRRSRSVPRNWTASWVSRRPSRGWDRSSRARLAGSHLWSSCTRLRARRRLHSARHPGGFDARRPPPEFVHVHGRDGALHWLATQEASMHAVRRLPQAQQVLERIADVLAGPVQRPR